MTDDKIVAYIVSPIQGRWAEHPKMAYSNLEIIVGVLKSQGFIEDHGEIESSHKFRFPFEKPNILELKNFFGDYEANALAKEVDLLYEDKSFFKTLACQSHYGEGYFIVRVVGDKNFRNKGRLDLHERLHTIKEMHKMEYQIIKEEK